MKATTLSLPRPSPVSAEHLRAYAEMRKLRTSANLTQAEAASIAEISRDRLASYEYGRAPWPEETRKKLVAGLLPFIARALNTLQATYERAEREEAALEVLNA